MRRSTDRPARRGFVGRRFGRGRGARWALIGVLAIGLIALACGDDGEGSPSPTPTVGGETASPTAAPTEAASPEPTEEPTPEPTAAPAPAFPITLEHTRGSTTIESQPTRVVALTDGAELASLLALDLQPVGFGQRIDPLAPWIADRIGAHAEVFTPGFPELPFEVIVALQPDLILAQEGFITPDTQPLLEAIAPTVATPFADWRKQLRLVAAATGTSDRAEELITETEALIAEFGERVPEALGMTSSVVARFPGEGSFYVFTEATAIGGIIGATTLEPLAAADMDSDDPSVQQYSLEELRAIEESDGLMVFDWFGDGSGLASFEELDAWGLLPAVQAGKVVTLAGDDAAAALFDSVLTVPYNLDLLERALTELYAGE